MSLIICELLLWLFISVGILTYQNYGVVQHCITFYDCDIGSPQLLF